MDDPEASDDSISITSTVISEKEESYEVECILAEKKIDGATKYLTAWKGYPETEHLWLPKKNFNENDIFIDWINTQTRVANGLEKPFDVRAWEKRCRAIRSATKIRKERRRLKRARLSKQGKTTSSSREQDGSSQRAGSDAAPKRSDKRIKRRSVHQDSPPSSLTSPASSSSSEDSDRPLMSRQESETFISNPKWTETETIALNNGLRQLQGPRWRELLGLYGRKGKINQDLKDRTPGDLYDKAKSICQEFVDSGREPPDYLKPFTKQDSNKGSRPSTPNVSSESRNLSRTTSKKGSRSTSADSMMVELQKKQRTLKAKDRGDSRPRKKTNLAEALEPVGGGEQSATSAKQVSGDKSKAPESSQTPAQKEKMTHANKATSETPQATQLISHPKKATPHTKPVTATRASSNNESHQRTQPEDGPRAKDPSQTSAVPQVERHLEDEAPGVHEIAKPTPKDAAQSESSHTNVPESGEAIRGEARRNTWSGTARTPTARPSLSNPPRQGAVESSSTGQSASKIKPKLGQIEPKKPSRTGDVTATWNAEPKRRRSNNWATENADPVDGQPIKRSYKLSVQNKIFKSRRDGRPPDPSCLVFIDPKTGKAPTTVPTPSTPAVSKTPLQLHQEEINAREAEQVQARELEDAMIISPNKPDQLPQTTEQNHKASPDKQEVLDTETRIPTPSKSVLGPTTGEMIDRPSHTDRSIPPGPTSPHPKTPISAPRGPKVETKRLATMSSQDCTKRTIPKVDPVNEALIDTNRSYSLEDSAELTLRANPSQEHQNELSQQKELSSVIGDMKIGVDDGEAIKVRFVGFGFEVKRLLLTIKVFPRTVKFVFNSFCLASEYKAYFPAELSDYLGSGSIVPYHHYASAVENIAETLANNLQGGLFFAQHFTMLMYPAGASAWGFLDKDLPSVHPGTVLRFAVRKPLEPALVDVHRSTTARLMTEEPEQHADIIAKIQKYPIHAKDMNINIVFRDMFDIDFDRLVAQTGDQVHPPTKIFFLCFIPQGCESYEPDPARRSALRATTSQEHDLFVKFLQANGAEEIYSMQKIGSQEIDRNGGWDYFCKNVKSGTIIFHDAMIRHDLIPGLGKHLLHGSVNVWKTSLLPMHPSEKHPHLIRLFPHGGVLLLTESLLLYRPHESLRLLMWFRRIHLPAKAPGTWKLAVRPRIREWLLDITNVYSSSGKDVFGYSMQIFVDILSEIYRLLQNPNPGNNRLMCHEWDYEIPTDEAPLVSSAGIRALEARKEWQGEGGDTRPDDEHIRQNDDLLTQWFAGWAIANLHSFRKFHIILGHAEDHPSTDTAISAYQDDWGHLEVMTFEEACKRHKVAPQSKLDAMEADRRRKIEEQLPAKKAATEKARREEREAARLALEARMQMYRDLGGTEEDARRGGRELLRYIGASEAEIEGCKIDMDKRRGSEEKWWEDDAAEADRDRMDMS